MKNALIEFQSPADIVEVLRKIGRTEDVRLSPDNRQLAIANFGQNSINLFDIKFDWNDDQPCIRILDYRILESAHFKDPHGISFLDDDHVVIANRAGNVDVFRLPVNRSGDKRCCLEPLASIKAGIISKVRHPGSVDSYRLRDESYRLLVCNNFIHTVTTHELKLGKMPGIVGTRILLASFIKNPDGVSVSPDTKLIAVSNHATGSILIYDNSSSLNRNMAPLAELKGIVCPHGLRFSPDGQRILVADAATPYLHAFDRPLPGWCDMPEPTTSARIIDEKLFNKGRYNALEGGVKGIEVDRTGSILVTTCEHQVLKFYHLDRLLKSEPGPTPGEIAEFSLKRDRELKWTWRTLKRRLLR